MRLISRRDAVVWAGGFLLVSWLLVITRFASEDPDSALYAAQSATLADQPMARWIAPEWWGHWDHHGLFREHPVGVFILPVVLASMGVPGVQAAYIVGIAAGIAAIVMTGWLTSRLTTVADGRAVMVLLQVIPLAFIFRIRANHEYPMLVCLLAAIIGIDAVRRSWRALWIVPLALCAAVLVKAAFVAVPLIAVACWLLLNPTRHPGAPGRPVAALGLAAVAVIGMSIGYDVWYRATTGESFWAGYWARQMAPLSIGAQPADQPGWLHHLGFYAIRIAWHPAPWSFLLVVAAWQTRPRWRETWQALTAPAQRGLAFAVLFAVTTVLLLATASRFAERYIFSVNWVLAAAGIAVALHQWPRFGSAMARLDARVPALPAVCWIATMVLRLTLGPLLPRLTD